MKRNIQLAYFLVFFYKATFWTGIWILYYLRFTDYQGIGFLETAMVISFLLYEVPTGALADLLGKKISLTLAFLLRSFGQVVMAFAPSYPYLILSIIILTFGYSLHSGTFEALIYDSLKQRKKTKLYHQVLANTQTIGLIATAIASSLGGLLYLKNPSLPYILTAIFLIIGLIFTFFLTEPKIDTEKFNWHNYLLQTKQGFHQLFKPLSRRKILSFLIVNAFLVIPYEFLTDALIIDFGYREKQLGIFYAVLFIFAALSAQLAPKIKAKLGSAKSFYLTVLLYSAILIISPKLGLILGGLSVFFRVSLFQVITNIVSGSINQVTKSKYRATTISTYNMLKAIPYAASAVLVGRLIDIHGAKSFASYFGFLMGITAAFLFLNYILKKTKKTSLMIK